MAKAMPACQGAGELVEGVWSGTVGGNSPTSDDRVVRWRWWGPQGCAGLTHHAVEAGVPVGLHRLHHIHVTLVDKNLPILCVQLLVDFGKKVKSGARTFGAFPTTLRKWT